MTSPATRSGRFGSVAAADVGDDYFLHAPSSLPLAELVMVMGFFPVRTERPDEVKLVGVNDPELTIRVVSPPLLHVISEFNRPADIVYFWKVQVLADFSMSCGPRAASAGVMHCLMRVVLPVIILTTKGGAPGMSMLLIVTAISHSPGVTPEDCASASVGTRLMTVAAVRQNVRTRHPLIVGFVYPDTMPG